MTFLKTAVKRVPPLDRGQRALRDRAHRRLVDWLEARISRRDHEILVVFGLRRSGNHLAIGWILDQVDGPAVFYNNINPDRAPCSARMTEYRLRRGPAPRIVLSYEDVSPAAMLAGPLAGYLRDRADQLGAGVRFALILRDPYNLFASRLQKWPERFDSAEKIAAQRALYAEHAALAAAPSPLWRDAAPVPILYNRLLTEPETRDRVADALGLRRGAAGLDRVSVYGHGSSFDGTARGGAEIARDVFSRWQRQADAPAFRAAVDAPEIAAAGQRLFGMDPPWRG